MNDVARTNHLFVCCACGKISLTRYGFVKVGKKEQTVSSKGWDESCMLNCQEFPIEKLVFNEDDTRVIEVKP